MGAGQGGSGVCGHCGGEIAEDGFAVKMAEAEQETTPEPRPSPTRESGFAEALRRRSAPEALNRRASEYGQEEANADA